MRPGAANDGDRLGRGELVRVLYRLGRSGATGILRIVADDGATEVVVLRRGQILTAEADPGGRFVFARLARLTTLPVLVARFDGGGAAAPPSGSQRLASLTAWLRRHLEAQLDATRAQALVAELAGARLVLRPELAPEPLSCDETDRRILAAMSAPRRLDQIWSLARTPRFRLVTFLHYLRAVGALGSEGVAAAPPVHAPVAYRLLGVAPDADRETLKRAYRRMARALHPDLHGGLDEPRRRELEGKLAELTAAYAQLGASA